MMGGAGLKLVRQRVNSAKVSWFWKGAVVELVCFLAGYGFSIWQITVTNKDLKEFF
jgi:hypothetical protein